MAYTRMALVRPDLLDKSKTVDVQEKTPPEESSKPLDAKTSFYESQLVRERLSPIASLVQILSHLQKKAYSVLHDDSLPTSDKLSRYNQLMLKSSIMMKKAKTVGRGAASINPGKMRRNNRRQPSPDLSDLDTDSDTDTFTSTRSNVHADSGEDAEVEDDDEEEEEEEKLQPGEVGMQVTREMEHTIRKTIPSTYQKSAMELYKLMAARGKGSFNWTPSGELVIRGQRVHGSNIFELLADASRKKSKVKPPVGRAIFVKAVKRFNPTLKHVKNKSLFREGASPTRSPHSPTKKKKKTRQQLGSGRGYNRIVWHTRL